MHVAQRVALALARGGGGVGALGVGARGGKLGLEVGGRDEMSHKDIVSQQLRSKFHHSDKVSSIRDDAEQGSTRLHNNE